MAIKKVKLPDNSTQDIHDARISGVDTTVTSGSSNVVTSGAVATAVGNYLPLAGGNMTGAGGIQYPTTNGYYPTHFISAGGGYSPNSGKSGVKVIVCDQDDVVTGMGQDLTGFNYELSIVTGASTGDTGYITFAKHNIASPTTYTRLGYFDAGGNLTATGDIRATGNDVYVGSATGSQCHQQYDDTNKCLKFIFD